MQIERLLDGRNMRDNWIDFWQKESMYCSQVNLTADTHGIILDWHKQSLKQFIDGLVEWEEGKIVQKFRGFPLAEYEEGINDARKLTIVYLKEIRNNL